MYYLYDGTFEGFLSAITTIMKDKKDLSTFNSTDWAITKEENQMLLMPNILINNIPNIMYKFGNYLTFNFGEEILKTIYHAFLSEIEGIENEIVRYIVLARIKKKDPCDMLYISCVKNVISAAKKVRLTSHRYYGLLRFRKISNKSSFCSKSNNTGLKSLSIPQKEPKEIFVAEFESEHNILSLLCEHFCKRYNSSLFAIVDRNRNICGIHIKGDDFTIIKTPTDFSEFFEYDTSFEDLWNTYFKNIAIPERKNLKLQRSNMPLKYRKYLIENVKFTTPQ